MSEQRSRIFVGIGIPEEVQRLCAQWQEEYRPLLPVRWIEAGNLHVTVVPPWEEEHPETVEKRLRKHVPKRELSAFSLDFHTVTFGPARRRPRLVWAEADTPAELVRSSTLVAQDLRRPRPKPQPKVHFTLARFNPADFALFPVQYVADSISWHVRVESLILYQSHLLPSGAEYEALYEHSF